MTILLYVGKASFQIIQKPGRKMLNGLKPEGVCVCVCACACVCACVHVCCQVMKSVTTDENL